MVEDFGAGDCHNNSAECQNPYDASNNNGDILESVGNHDCSTPQYDLEGDSSSSSHPSSTPSTFRHNTRFHVPAIPVKPETAQVLTKQTDSYVPNKVEVQFSWMRRSKETRLERVDVIERLGNDSFSQFEPPPRQLTSHQTTQHINKSLQSSSGRSKTRLSEASHFPGNNTNQANSIIPRAKSKKSGLYCVCHKKPWGTMIACDNDGFCPFGWFHLDCVRLKKAPPENGKLPFYHIRNLLTLMLQKNGIVGPARKYSLAKLVSRQY